MPKQAPAKSTFIWLAAVFIAVSGASWFLLSNKKATQNSGASPSNSSRSLNLGRASPQDPGPIKGFQALEFRERQLDETAWASEMVAEHYEETWVNLWDDLRQSSDGLEPLSRFPFKELLLGSAKEPEHHEWDISLTRFGPPKEKLDPVAWKEFLSTLWTNGYRLEQSEWRHAVFEPASANGTSPARSTIAMSLHISNAPKQRRMILRGELKIEWEQDSGDHQSPIPKVIDATNVELLERSGQPAFETVLTKPISQKGDFLIDPVILYDLDGDGLSEIILATQNQVYWNRGGGVSR